MIALALIWAGLIAFSLTAINRYRSRLEGTLDERVIGRIQANGFVKFKQEKEIR